MGTIKEYIVEAMYVTFLIVGIGLYCILFQGKFDWWLSALLGFLSGALIIGGLLGFCNKQYIQKSRK